MNGFMNLVKAKRLREFYEFSKNQINDWGIFGGLQKSIKGLGEFLHKNRSKNLLNFGLQKSIQ